MPVQRRVARQERIKNREGKEMLKTLKKINSVLRVVFIGFVVLYGIVKIFDVVPKETGKKKKGNIEHSTSEFDEIW